MKVKIKCNKFYGTSDKNSIDADYIDTKILNKIICKFSSIETLEITEEIVDYYNNNKTTSYRKSYKTANALAVQLRKLIKIKEENLKQVIPNQSFMKIICDCGNEDFFNTIDEKTGEQTTNREDEGQYARINNFRFWSSDYEIGIVCDKCGKKIWIFK
jgi:hypothetical protein